MKSFFGSVEEDDANRLDSVTVAKLESMLPQKAKELLEYLKSKREIRLYDRKKLLPHVPLDELPRAFTCNLESHSEIWLIVDDEHVKDSFIHEIVQVYVYTLGYKQASLEEPPTSC